LAELPTRTELIIGAIRKTLLLEREGTATAATSTSIADTNSLVHATNNDLRGREVYIHTGTGLDQAVRIASASTAATSLVTVPTFAVTPSTDSQYLLIAPHQGISVIQLAKDGLDDAMRNIDQRYLLSKTNKEYVIQDLLWGYGGMQRWTAGTAAASDGFTLSTNGTESVARSTKTPNQFAYSAEVTSDGTLAATYSRSVSQFGQYHGLTATVHGWFYSDTASRVTVTVTDGVTTKTTAAFTATATWYEFGSGKDINIDGLHISENPKELTVSFKISAGAAVVANVADMQLYLGGLNLQRYEIPTTNGYGAELTSYRWIHSILVEDYPGSWSWSKEKKIDKRHISIVDEEGTRFLYILRTDLNGLAGHRLLITGQEGPVLLTTGTQATPVRSNYLTAYAAWFVLSNLPSLTPKQEQKRADLEVEWQRADRLIRAKAHAGSVQVERS
jgi:hypothetical protein